MTAYFDHFLGLNGLPRAKQLCCCCIYCFLVLGNQMCMAFYLPNISLIDDRTRGA